VRAQINTQNTRENGEAFITFTRGVLHVGKRKAETSEDTHSSTI